MSTLLYLNLQIIRISLALYHPDYGLEYINEGIFVELFLPIILILFLH